MIRVTMVLRVQYYSIRILFSLSAIVTVLSFLVIFLIGEGAEAKIINLGRSTLDLLVLWFLGSVVRQIYLKFSGSAGSWDSLFKNSTYLLVSQFLLFLYSFGFPKTPFDRVTALTGLEGERSILGGIIRFMLQSGESITKIFEFVLPTFSAGVTILIFLYALDRQRSDDSQKNSHS